ncbi:MAG: helix-turn-helix domain-containing protein [Pseudomonadota bacterium]
MPPISKLDPFVAAVDALGDAWTFLITREAFFGANRFDDFSKRLRISRTRLSERLKHLVASGLLTRELYQDSPPRYEYRLTQRGLDVYPIALHMIEWGKKWTRIKSDVALRHSDCGHTLGVRAVCRCCGEEVKTEDLIWPPIVPLDQAVTDKSNVRGWKRVVDVASVSTRQDPAEGLLGVVGDRWSMLIIYGALQREFRFREAQAKLGIAHNILSARLKNLVSAGVLERTNPGRQAPYRISSSGEDLLPAILAMRTWAMDHLVDDAAEWNAILHRQCGSNIRTDASCKHCARAVTPRSVLVKAPN